MADSTNTASTDARASTDAATSLDGQHIDASRDTDLQTWAKKFNVTPEQLKEAITAVGDRAADVELHLTGARATSNQEQTAAAK